MHHLFPGVCHTHYPALAPIIMSTCVEFGLPYKVFPNFRAAMLAHFAHLKIMGLPSHVVPSLVTIG